MAGKINLYNLGTMGVDLTKSIIHADDGTLRKAQNAVPDPRGEFGGVSKRDGLGAINSTSAGGSVQGAIDVPLPATAKAFLGRTNAAGTAQGWNTSTDMFATASTTISSGVPANPADIFKMVDVWGGTTVAYFTRPYCVLDNRFYYAGNNYTLGSTAPTIRVFNGVVDRDMIHLPANPDVGTTPPRGVLGMTAYRGLIYVSTWDGGTTSANFKGSVYELNPITGSLTKLGATFPTGILPGTLIPYLGKLWVGTISNDTAIAGRVYWIRFAGDTAFTLDHTTTIGRGEITDMAVYKGLLYVSTRGGGGNAGLVKVRSLAGVWSTSRTGPAATAINGYDSLMVFGDNLYAGFSDTTGADYYIEKFDNSSWSSVLTVNLTGFPMLFSFGGTLLAANMYYASGGLHTSTNGTSWTDRSGNVTDTNLPYFVVLGVS